MRSDMTAFLGLPAASQVNSLNVASLCDGVRGKGTKPSAVAITVASRAASLTVAISLSLTTEWCRGLWEPFE